MRIVLATVLVFLVINLIPFAVYAPLSLLTGLEPPSDQPALFMVQVLIEKLGHAVAFVGIFACGRGLLHQNWLLYAGAWFAMFALGELSQALGPSYTWEMAGAGILSEAIYLPAAALVTRRVIES